MTKVEIERRKDPLRACKGLILDVLRKNEGIGATLSAIMAIAGKKSREDVLDFDKSLRQLVYSGIIKCDIKDGKMFYRHGENK